ncbi:Helicase-like transcription factor CHR28 [Sesamum angolense]|uniref:Helicase-like transcription factor CHR28 n=1 Tax=Sesamum angolense TaxID=2727404 RepID=A0AAE1WM64_9LAMI|nr:Helicase-like transcription factor CHR28 [Sesamum angolense]
MVGLHENATDALRTLDLKKLLCRLMRLLVQLTKIMQIFYCYCCVFVKHVTIRCLSKGLALTLSEKFPLRWPRCPKELLVNLLKQLETSLAICLVCRDPPENAVVTMCGHVFCYQCVSDYLTGEDNTCPAPECKEQLGADVVYSRSTLRRCISDDIDGDIPVSYDSENL